MHISHQAHSDWIKDHEKDKEKYGAWTTLGTSHEYNHVRCDSFIMIGPDSMDRSH